MRAVGLGENCYSARMSANREDRAPNVRHIASGDGWRLSEFVCDAGPDDRPFEERHDDVSISAVVSGSFDYRTHAGAAFMHPGGILLGAAGRCYECGHEHGRGDRCVAYAFRPDYFAEIACDATGQVDYEFATPALPASLGLAPLAARAEALVDAQALATEEAAIRFAHAAARTAAGAPATRGRIAARDKRRVADVLRFVETHADEALDLDRLAAIAGVSKFHFLRSFARVVGLTPYRYLLLTRLRRAGAAIAATDRPISEIAFDAGFGDLSTFNAHFRAAMGANPGRWRRERGQI